MLLSIVPVLTLLFFSLHQVQSNLQLENINKFFRTSYQESRTYLLNTINPLIIVIHSEVILIHRGQRTVIDTTPTLYHNLKAISHIPFTIYLRLFTIESTNRNLTSSELTTLKVYLQKIRRVRKSINLSDFAFDNELFQTQLHIIDLSIEYLRSVFRSKQLNQTSLKEFCHKFNPLFSSNIRLAARTQVNELHRTVNTWYTKSFNDTERNTVHVLLLGPKAPRVGFLIQQYFEKLLGGKHLEGKRILYAENLSTESAGLDVLGSWLLDVHVAEAFFNDQTRLHRDLLADDATEYINELS